MLLYVGLYVETAVLNRMINLPRIDPWLLRADHALCGFQPAEAFPLAMAQPLFSEFMHLSYVSYYLMVGGVGLWLSLRDRAACRHFVTVVSLVFYACYATYLFVPAVGPRVLFEATPERAQFVAQYGREPRPTPTPNGGEWAQRTFALVEQHGEIPGAAFPSSHVAVALVTVIGSMAAHCLARYTFRGHRLVRFLILTGLVLPPQLVILALFQILLDINLYNTLTGLILVYVATHIAMTVYILEGFFAQIPQDLFDAARMDGYSDFEIF